VQEGVTACRKLYEAEAFLGVYHFTAGTQAT
jgi:hypothetical protein